VHIELPEEEDIVARGDAVAIRWLKRYATERAENSDIIKEIVNREPKTADELLRIKGMGPVKVRKYGDSILKLVEFFGREVVFFELFSEHGLILHGHKIG